MVNESRNALILHLWSSPNSKITQFQKLFSWKEIKTEKWRHFCKLSEYNTFAAVAIGDRSVISTFVVIVWPWDANFVFRKRF